MLQDVLVQFTQRLCGLDTELVEEPSARRVKGGQRVGLSSAAIQRRHLQLHQALLERMRDDKRLQLSQQVAVTAQLEVELDRLDDRGQPFFLQPRALPGEQTVRAHARERLSAPDTQRLLKPLTSDPRLIVHARATRPAERLLPAVDITLAESHLQQVAARVVEQPAAVGARLHQPLAEPRDVHLEAVTRPRGRLLAPQLIDQLVDGHHATAHQRQHREQRSRPLTPQRHLSAIHPRLNRTEQLDPKPVGAVGHAGQHRVSYVTRAPDSTPDAWLVGERLVGGYRPLRRCPP